MVGVRMVGGPFDGEEGPGFGARQLGWPAVLWLFLGEDGRMRISLTDRVGVESYYRAGVVDGVVTYLHDDLPVVEPARESLVWVLR